MKTATYKSIRDGVIRKMGLDASLTPLPSQSAAIAEYVQAALEAAWIFYPWPDVTLIEERTPTGSPAHTIAIDQAGETYIADFLQIFNADPEDSLALAVSLHFTTTDAAATIADEAHTAGENVWVRFRIPSPAITSTAYSAATTYAPGDTVYFDTTGDCYVCSAATTGNAPSNTAFWRRQEIPHYLAEHAKAHAYAETLQEDGQIDKATYMLTRAKGILEDKQDDFWMKKDRYHHYTAAFNH